MINLRPYQNEAIESIFSWFDQAPGDPLIVLPTGTGKSMVIAGFAQRVLTTWADTKILVVTHVRELVAQNHAALLRVWPEAPAGINSAGIGRRDTQQPIVFCSIQSVHKSAHLFDRVDLVLIDEAHLIPGASDTMYQRFIKNIRAINPYAKVIGLTATPYRLDTGRLDEGKNALFAGVAYEAKLLDMIEAGYLSPLVSKSTKTKLDVTGVGKRGGEYIASELEAAVDIDAINRSAVAEIVERGADRKSWLIFCSGVKHAQHVAEIVREHGITCETIFGDTPKAERDRIIAEFKAGRIRCLASMAVLTTGFDAPAVDLIAMLRPTQSTGLYVQIMGRGMRLSPGKANCLVLDFAGNVLRHGPVDAVNPKKPGEGGEREAPVKECPDCGSYVHAALRTCSECGHLFPAPEPKITHIAASAPVLSSEVSEPEWVRVTEVFYAVHAKPGKPVSLRVDYVCGLVRHSEWVCLEHEGYARTKAVGWWLRRAGVGAVAPRTVAEAMQTVQRLPRPVEIKVRREGKFIAVVDHKLPLAAAA